MELNMGNKDMTLKEVFESINARLGHLEDICADNRAIIVKLVKQGNQIIEYLKQLEIEVLEEEPMMSIDNDISLNPSDAKREERLQSIKEIKLYENIVIEDLDRQVDENLFFTLLLIKVFQ